MSRLKYTRQRCNMTRISNATRYLRNSRRPPGPNIFRYFFDLHVFMPWNWIDVDDLANLFTIPRDSALEVIREIQAAYGRLPYNYITVKDLCKYYKIDINEIQTFFYFQEMSEFLIRAEKLKYK